MVHLDVSLSNIFLIECYFGSNKNKKLTKWTIISNLDFDQNILHDLTMDKL